MSDRCKSAGFVVVVAALAVVAHGCDVGAGYPLRDAAVDTSVEMGSVMINGGFDQCPSSVLLQVTPLMVTVGGTISVSARAPGLTAADGGSDGGGSDAHSAISDGGRPDAPAPTGDGAAAALSISWTADTGSFANPSAAQTSFTCTDAGPVTLKANISDGTCVTTASAAVYCLGRLDGGAGGAGGSGGSNGTDGGDGGMLVNTCQQMPPQEPLSGGDCGTCTTGNCSLGVGKTDGCCGLTSLVDQTLCEAVVACLSASATACVDSLGDATTCYCGNSGNDCFMVPGAANGPCVGAVVAAAKNSSPPAVQGQFTSPASPLGRAVNLIACRGSFCSAECGIP